MEPRDWRRRERASWREEPVGSVREKVLEEVHERGVRRWDSRRRRWRARSFFRFAASLSGIVERSGPWGFAFWT